MARRTISATRDSSATAATSRYAPGSGSSPSVAPRSSLTTPRTATSATAPPGSEPSPTAVSTTFIRAPAASSAARTAGAGASITGRS